MSVQVEPAMRYGLISDHLGTPLADNFVDDTSSLKMLQMFTCVTNVDSVKSDQVFAS